MRPSRILKEARAGKVATIAKINIPHPAVIDLCGLAGLSGVWLCNEHGPNDWSLIDHCVRAGKEHDLDIIVRIAKGSYSDYIKPFEADAAGIMVPHVTSAEEAEWVVDHCRCHPVGNRPIDGGNADGRYCQHEAAEYLRHCNEEKLILLQIESREGAAAVDAIAAVPGYDGLVFGPGDFTHRLGKFGQTNDPEVVEARARVEAAMQKHGKFGFAVGLPDGPDALRERGYGCVCVVSDVISLGASLREAREHFEGGGSAPSIYDK